MIQFAGGVGILNYVEFLNLLEDEYFLAKMKYIAPFEFISMYRIIQLYNECVKRSGIMIKDPNLTKQFVHILGSIV